MITVPAMWSDAANAKSSPVRRNQVPEKLLRYEQFRNLKPQQCMLFELKSPLFECGSCDCSARCQWGNGWSHHVLDRGTWTKTWLLKRKRQVLYHYARSTFLDRHFEDFWKSDCPRFLGRIVTRLRKRPSVLNRSWRELSEEISRTRTMVPWRPTTSSSLAGCNVRYSR